MHTKKQNLKRILQRYIMQELKSYRRFRNFPRHKFSKTYRRKMNRLAKRKKK